MPTLFLQYPRLAVSLRAPAALLPDLRRNFAPALVETLTDGAHHDFEVRLAGGGLSLACDGTAVETSPSVDTLTFSLEEILENQMIANLDDWIGLHAGAAAAGDAAIAVIGPPDTGKTTSMLQLSEMGLELLCEEVTPIDPATGFVHPFPQRLTLDRTYTDQFCSLYPIERGTLTSHGDRMARYAPHGFHTRPARLAAIVLPAYRPGMAPALAETDAAAVLTDLLRCCFPPSGSDERLFDSVIALAAQCRLFTLRSDGITSARRLLAQTIDTVIGFHTVK